MDDRPIHGPYYSAEFGGKVPAMKTELKTTLIRDVQEIRYTLLELIEPAMISISSF